MSPLITILLNLIFSLVQKLVYAGFFKQVEQLVLSAASTAYVDIAPSVDLPDGLSANKQRKNAVEVQLKAMGGTIGPVANSVGGVTLSLLVDAAVNGLRKKGVIN